MVTNSLFVIIGYSEKKKQQEIEKMVVVVMITTNQMEFSEETNGPICYSDRRKYLFVIHVGNALETQFPVVQVDIRTIIRFYEGQFFYSTVEPIL
jgi:hypothetical protein